MTSVGKTGLDCRKYKVFCGGKSVQLSNKEFQITELMFRNPGVVFSADDLMYRIWPDDSDSEIGAVWTHIGYIRRKLKQIDADVEIRTLRGAGYMLERK